MVCILLVDMLKSSREQQKPRAIKEAVSSIVTEAAEAQPACIGDADHCSGCIQSESDVNEFRLVAPSCNKTKKRPRFSWGIKDPGGLGKCHAETVKRYVRLN